MSPLELFHKWRGKRECTVIEAWMAGYAAGCHKGYHKGQSDGQKESLRERNVLVRALKRAFELAPEAYVDIAGPKATDARDEAFLVVKILAEAERRRAGGKRRQPRPAAEQAGSRAA